MHEGMRRSRAAVAQRMGRVRVDRLPGALATVIVGLWAAWLAIAVALLVPGAIAPLGSEPFSGSALTGGANRTAGILVVWAVLLGTSAVAGSSAVVLLALRPRRARTGPAPAVLALAISLVPLLFLLSAGAVPAAGATLVLGLAGTVLAAVAGSLTPSRPRDTVVAVTALLLVAVWLPLLVDGLTSAVPLSLLSSYAVLGSAAVAVTGFVTLGGVASAAETANATASVAETADGIASAAETADGTRGARIVSRRSAGIVMALAVAVLVLRFTLLHDVFGELEAELWSLRTVASWPHAVLIGILIVVFALRSGRRPYASRGQKAVTVIVTLAAGLSNLVLVGAAVLLFVLLAVTGEVTDPTPYLDSITVAGLVVVLALVPIALRPGSARTTGRVGAVIGLLYLVPMLVSLIFSLSDAGVPPFWASPTQVVVVVVVAAVVIFVVGAVRRQQLAEPAMLVRLAAIPIVAVHAGELLPAVWSDALAQPLVVLLSLLAFLLFSPAPDPDQDARVTARRIIAASALQLAILGTYAGSIVLDYDGEVFTVVAVIWLAVPVTAILCCRVAPVPVPPPVVVPEVRTPVR